METIRGIPRYIYFPGGISGDLYRFAAKYAARACESYLDLLRSERGGFVAAAFLGAFLLLAWRWPWAPAARRVLTALEGPWLARLIVALFALDVQLERLSLTLPPLAPLPLLLRETCRAGLAATSLAAAPAADAPPGLGVNRAAEDNPHLKDLPAAAVARAAEGTAPQFAPGVAHAASVAAAWPALQSLYVRMEAALAGEREGTAKLRAHIEHIVSDIEVMAPQVAALLLHAPLPDGGGGGGALSATALAGGGALAPVQPEQDVVLPAFYTRPGCQMDQQVEEARWLAKQARPWAPAIGAYALLRAPGCASEPPAKAGALARAVEVAALKKRLQLVEAAAAAHEAALQANLGALAAHAARLEALEAPGAQGGSSAPSALTATLATATEVAAGGGGDGPASAHGKSPPAPAAGEAPAPAAGAPAPNASAPTSAAAAPQEPAAPPPLPSLGGGGAAAAAAEGATPVFGTPVPQPLAPAPGVADPTLGLSRAEVLGGGEPGSVSSAAPWARHLGYSSLRGARYRVSPAARAAYEAAMGEEACDVVAGLAAQNEARKGAAGGSGGGDAAAAAAAVAKELAFFAQNTSNSVWSSSIFVRADEADTTALKAAITGAEHTPYANGLFLFDIACKPDFPASPPHVLIVSREGGGVRWNPNLYSDGKVCLSLLGTWSGPGWKPGESTLYQVLMSIQTQIMNKHPKENEPGHECGSGKPSPMHLLANAMYNTEVRLATLQYGMTKMLRAPPRFFEDAAIAHFTMKRGEVAAQAVLWAEDALLLARYHLDVLVTQNKAHAGLASSLVRAYPGPVIRAEGAPADALGATHPRGLWIPNTSSSAFGPQWKGPRCVEDLAVLLAALRCRAWQLRAKADPADAAALAALAAMAEAAKAEKQPQLPPQPEQKAPPEGEVLAPAAEAAVPPAAPAAKAPLHVGLWGTPLADTVEPPQSGGGGGGGAPAPEGAAGKPHVPSLQEPRSKGHAEEWAVLQNTNCPVFWIAWSTLVCADDLLAELEKL